MGMIEKEKKMMVGVVWNCAAELKLLLTVLLFLCSFLIIFQFLPSRLYLSVSDFRNCISTTQKLTTSSPPPPPPPLSSPPPPPVYSPERTLDNGVVKRSFLPIGSAAYSFILMSAYRAGLNSFAVNALSSKPLHVFANPSYTCQWLPHSAAGTPTNVTGIKTLPDWGYGHIYTVVIINCTFPSNAGDDDAGGELLIHVATNGGGDTDVNRTDTITALTESPGAFSNLSKKLGAEASPDYEYMYCGSPLYGKLSPQRVREWLAYHVKMLGERSHFVIYDAGGVHPEVMEVLKAWMERGYVTLQDVREEERFDGYYHNQFLVVNDCLHRFKFMAKWMFFFDLDEFLFVPKRSTIKTVMDSLSEFSQFTIEQMPMSNKLCLSEDRGKSYRKWGFEKLVYKDSITGIRRDRKYVIQPRDVFATGVHMSQNMVGKTTHKTEGRIMYYHYHGTISQRREPCRQLVNTTTIKVDGTPYVLDTTMRDAAGAVKRFELKMIGSRLQRTRQ